jgi:hypothetical protein
VRRRRRAGHICHRAIRVRFGVSVLSFYVRGIAFLQGMRVLALGDLLAGV